MQRRMAPAENHERMNYFSVSSLGFLIEEESQPDLKIYTMIKILMVYGK